MTGRLTADIMFRDRKQAGEQLAKALSGFKGQDLVVLAVPRGGVIVAKEVATFLHSPLDVVVTRKIGAPGNPEYAIGSIGEEGEALLDSQAAGRLGVPDSYISEESVREREEVKSRIARFRGDAKALSLEGKVVLLIDDGIATGYTLLAALRSVMRRRPERVIIAVPVAPREVVSKISKEAEVICLNEVDDLGAIGEFYGSFDQIEDDEVRKALAEARAAHDTVR